MEPLPINEESVLHFAMRYALGRMTAAPSIVTEELAAKWPRIRLATRKLIKQEIETAILCGDAGHACDVNTWRQVLALA